MQTKHSESENRNDLPHTSAYTDDGAPPSDSFPVIEPTLCQEERADAPAGTSVSALLEELDQLRANEEVRRLLEAAGVYPDPVKIRALAALDTVEERQALIETWPAGVGRKPRSVSPAAGFGRSQPLPHDPKSFATMIR